MGRASMHCLVGFLAVVVIQTESPIREGVKTFAPGVTIDWPNLTVELEAEVVLQDGPLELFACSPRTKEHESVLVVMARPREIFQAMGLIGLTPGSPTRYIKEDDRWEPARGDRVDLRVRWGEGDAVRFARPQEWMLRSDRDKLMSPPELRWVFAGSLTSKEGRFAADLEGTVAAVVDFEASLIALSTSHTADNEQLWLMANKERIPARGTRCRLLIRSAFRPPMPVTLRDDGSLLHRGYPIQVARLAEMLRPTASDDRTGALDVCLDADEGAKDEFVRKIQAEGFFGPIRIQKAPCPPAEPPSVPKG